MMPTDDFAVEFSTPDNIELGAEHWTEERMANATPVQAPQLSPGQLKAMLERVLPQLPAAFEGLPKVIPGSDGGAAAVDDRPSTVAGTPTEADVKERPFWNGGKLFFTEPGKGDYVGSAQFVGDKRVIMTAAHCVRDGTTGSWYKNFEFRRAYKNGGGQSVKYDRVVTYRAWWDKGPNYAYDYAFLHMKSDSGAGWLGLATGLGYQNMTAIGYPSNYGGGKYMQRVDGTRIAPTNGVAGMAGNPMGPGCSGGAWIGALSQNPGGNYAVGLNSYGPDNDEYGPYFTSATTNLYLNAKNGG